MEGSWPVSIRSQTRVLLSASFCTLVVTCCSATHYCNSNSCAAHSQQTVLPKKVPPQATALHATVPKRNQMVMLFKKNQMVMTGNYHTVTRDCLKLLPSSTCTSPKPNCGGYRLQPRAVGSNALPAGFGSAHVL